MHGTPKQREWAENIRAEIAAQLPDMSSNPIADKAKSYLLAIDEAAFWIEIAKGQRGIDLLRALIGRGLRIRGDQYSDRATMDKQTGVITVTWTEHTGPNSTVQRSEVVA